MDNFTVMAMDLESYLKENKIWHKFIEKPKTVHTADAAAKSGMDLKRVAKSLVLLDEENSPIMAIIPGDCKLSFEKLRKVAGVKKVHMVPFEQAHKYSGYAPGATPMVHHKSEMRVFFDEKFTDYGTIFGGGGTRTRLLELKTIDVITLNRALVADITK